MLEVLLVSLVLAVVALVPGFPIACVVNGHRARGGLQLLFDAVLLGSVGQSLWALALMRLDRFETWPFVVAISGTAVLAGWLASSTGRYPRSLERPGFAALALAATVGVVAFVYSSEPSPFFFQIGDMGEYMTNAQHIAQGQQLQQSFPHLFPVWLSLAEFLVPSATPSHALFLSGVLTIGGTARVASLFSDSLIPPTFIGLLLAVNVVPSWFSAFPASESLSAMLLVASIGFLVRAAVETDGTDAVVAGLLMLPLLLTRGSALVLAPAIAVSYLVAALTGDAIARRLWRHFTFAAVFALSLGHLYNITYLPVYYIDRQLIRQAPSSLFEAAETLGWLDQGPRAFVVPGLTMVLVLAVGSLLTRLGMRMRSRGVPSSTPTVTLVCVAIVVVLLGSDGFISSSLRYGLVFLSLATFGLIVGAVPPGRQGHRDSAVAAAHMLVLLYFAAGAILFASRVPTERFSYFYLYWDRYLFSETFPPAAAAAALGTAEIWRRIKTTQTWATMQPWGVAGGLIVGVVALVPLSRTTARVVDEPFLGGADDLLESLDDATGDRTSPIIYGATTTPKDWIFPANTYRAIALPLHQIYNRTILNLPAGAIEPDPVPTGLDVLALMDKHDLTEVYVLMLFDIEQPPTVFAEGLYAEELDVISAELPVINKEIGGGEDHHFVEFDFMVLRAVRT